MDVTLDRVHSRLPGLDGLRALAIGLVIICHVQKISPLPIPHWAAAVVERGGFGVEIFFVLSGFLITWLLLREEEQSGNVSLRSFYLRRALRILPAAMTFLIVIAALAAAGISSADAREIAASTGFVRNLVNGSLDTGHFWSLSIEEQFYLLWPALAFRVVSPRWRIGVTIALLAAAPFWRQANYIAFGGAEYVNSWRGDLRYDALLTGCLLALLCRSPQWRERMSSPAISGGLAAGAAIAIVCFALSPAALRLGPLRALIPSVSFVGVAIVINHLMRSPRTIAGIAMNAAPLTWVGALSYSLYLWQQPLCYPGACLAMRAPACVAAVIALAAASHYLIERPFLRLRRPRETPAPEPPRDREPVRATPDNA